MTNADDPYRRAAESVRSAATHLTPPTAAQAGSRARRRSQRLAAVSMGAVVLLGAGVVASRATDARPVLIEAAADPGSTAPPGSSGTTPFGTEPVGSAPVITEPTTSVAPTTSTTVPTTTTASAGPPTTLEPSAPPSSAPIGDLVGTYDGIEHYSIVSERCPHLQHHLDADVSTGSGERWTFVADYCGETSSEGWQGGGAVVLRGPNGEVLNGRFSHAAPPDSGGDPYTVQIVSGDGTTAGATGQCDLTVTLTEISFGTQRQSGAIRCSIVLPR